MSQKKMYKNLKNDKSCVKTNKKKRDVRENPWIRMFDSNVTPLQCAILCDSYLIFILDSYLLYSFIYNFILEAFISYLHSFVGTVQK